MDKGESGYASRSTKISLPRLRKHYPRTRLFQRLDSLCDRQIAWISAPAGAGKTTLVSSYLESCGHRALWYQLDERDADPATFFFYLREALRNLLPRRASLPLLTPEYLTALPLFARSFFEQAFGRIRGPAFLVFDNYQELPDTTPLHDLLSTVFGAIPDGIRVFVLSRGTPPPGFARLQAEQALAVVGREELRLTMDEAQGIARLRKESDLAEDRVAAIQARTEGWAAGMVLLLEQEEAEWQYGNELKTDSPSTPDALFDYFASEVFAKTDPDKQRLLMQTAVLPLMTASSVVELTGEPRASRLIAKLSRENYFTESHRSTETAYQYHPLFRQFLLARARRELAPDDLRYLQGRAAAILERSGEEECALVLYEASRDWQAMAGVLERLAARMLSQGRGQVLEQWLRTLPQDLVAGNAWLLYWVGLCRLPFAPGQGREYLEKALTKFRDANLPSGTLQAWSAIVDSIYYEGRAFHEVDPWLALLGELPFDADLPTGVRDEVIVTLLGALVMRDPQHPDIERWEREAFSLFQSDRNRNLRICSGVHLGVLAMWRGNSVGAAEVVERLALMRAKSEIPPLKELTIYIIEALNAWLVKGECDKCLQIVDRALARAEQTGVHLLDSHLLEQGLAAALSTGDMVLAEQMRSRLATGLDHGRIMDLAYYHYLATWHALQRNDMSDAREHVRIAETLLQELGFPFGSALFAVAKGLTHLRSGNLLEAREALAVAAEWGKRCGSDLVAVMTVLARAELAVIEGNAEEHLSALSRGFGIARERNLRNLHLWQPRAMAKLCASALEAGIESDYVQRLICTRRLTPEAPGWALPHWPWPIRIRAFGLFRVELSGVPLQFPHKVQRRPLDLLMALIAFGGRDVPEHRLSAALWADAEADAAHAAFTSALHRLRKLLGDDDAVVLSAGRLTLNDRKVWLDVWAFEHGLEASTPVKALALYQGPFLGLEADAAWALPLRERLRAKFVQASRNIASSFVAQGLHDDAVAMLERGIAADETAEDLYRELIRAHQGAGRRPDALRAYHRCRHALHGLLGLDPDTETEALHNALKNDREHCG